MKKKLLSVVLMAAAVVMTSCKKDEGSSEPQPEGRFDFSGYIKRIDTKTSLDDSKIYWDKNDTITVNGVRYLAVPRSYDQGIADFAKCDSLPAPSGELDAFYPAGIQTTADEGILPVWQTYSEGGFENIPLYGQSEDNTFEFNAICGILAVKVNDEDISKVKSIRVTAPNDALSGAFFMDNGVAKLTEEATNAGGRVVLTCVEPVYPGIDETTFLIAIPAREYTSLYIELSSDGVTYSKGMLFCEEDFEKFEVKRNKMFPVSFKAGKPTANCYMVSSENDVQNFFVTAKGNSSELLENVKSARVLWESFGTEELPQEGDLVSDVDYSNGIITYTAKGGVSGNAVIAAYDNLSPESGNIVWSWHIWLCPGYNPDTSATDRHIYNNSYAVVMNRNLGAVASSWAPAGLLYQWGRKDPFLGSYGSKPTVSTSSNWNYVLVQDNSGDNELNLRYSIQNPTTFITNGGPTKDWYCIVSAYKNDFLWRSSTDEKTIYDPCPVGWRVPAGGLEGLWATSFGFYGDNFNAKNGVVPGGFDFSQTDPALVGVECVYPTAGMRSRSTGGLQEAQKEGYYWSSTPVTQDDGSLCGNRLFFRYSTTASFRNVYPSSTSPRADGLSVRCVQE